MSKTTYNLLLIKGAVCVGILVAHFVPIEWSAPISIAANMLWLWRT